MTFYLPYAIIYNVAGQQHIFNIFIMRVCWNWQTGTFEGRVSLAYGFKSRHSHFFILFLWKDGWAGLRRTTGTRVTVYPVRGFESLSFRCIILMNYGFYCRSFFIFYKTENEYRWRIKCRNWWYWKTLWNIKNDIRLFKRTVWFFLLRK